jgi:hypothetical protein
MTKQARIRLVMSGLIVAGLAVAAGASARTLGALYMVTDGVDNTRYRICNTNIFVYAEAKGYNVFPGPNTPSTCTVTAQRHNQWQYNFGCPNTSIWQQPKIRNSFFVYGPGVNSNPPVGWTTFTFNQILTEDTQPEFAGPCKVDRQSIAFSQGSL